MHILQLVPSLEVGGVERGVLDLAKGLIARGNRVSVVSSGGALVDRLVALGAAHYTLPIHRKSPWTIRRVVPELCRLIDTTNVDIIHARSRMPGWAGYLASWRTGRPFVTTCHGFYRPHPASRVMGWGRTVIVPSTALGRYCIDRLGVPPERLRVIPRGVDLSEFRYRGLGAASHQPQTPWRIGLVGRFTAIKGHDVAIRALAQALPRHPDIQLCVIGDAPAGKPQVRQQLEALAQSLGVDRAIEWMGTRNDVPACLAGLDLVVVPSVYPESFGRSVVEAQAIGVPVIASQLGALAEVIEPERTGLLVPPGDSTALAQAIGRLIEDHELRSRLVESGRQRVEAVFSVTRMIDGTAAVYEECAVKPRIAVWKLSAMGDVVLATPSLRAIRRQFPESFIALIVGRAVVDVVAHCPYVDDVIVYDEARGWRGWRNRVNVLRRIRRLGIDRSIDLQNSRLTHAMACLAGIPMRVGYDRRWGRLLNRPVTLPKEPLSPVAHQQHVLAAAGVAPDGDALELWPSEREMERADRLLSEAGVDLTKPIVGLHPWASPRWKTKQWDLARWASLCDRLSAQGMQVLLTGSGRESAAGRQLCRLATSKPMVMIGQTDLMELACLIRRCQAFVTVDSAPLHIAAAMRVPVIALFGPTDPMRHAPQGSGAPVRVITKRVACSPCYSTWCRTVTHACMRTMTVDEVMNVVEEILSNAECGMRNAERPTSIPNSELRTPNSF